MIIPWTLFIHRSSLRLGCIFLAFLCATGAYAQFLQFPQGEFPLTNYKRASVPMSEIMSGGPPRDGIPAIDRPDFTDAEGAADWLADREPVIVLTVNDETRAYPLQIMMYHEIVNDVVAGVPVTVTFCPLCNASIVFESQIGVGEETQTLTFGTTGRLRNSDLIMYDRQTESWWQQFTGLGIVGDYTDTQLVTLPSTIASFSAFREAFPDSKVLSKETGFARPYGNNPYRGYDDIDSNPFLFRGDLDPRLPPMERVLSLRTNDNNQLIPLTPLVSRPIVNLEIDASPVVILATTSAASALDAGRIADSRPIPAAAAYSARLGDDVLSFQWIDGVIKDDQTGTSWNTFGYALDGPLGGSQLKQIDHGVHFAFAWLAFDPEAEIVNLDN